MNIYKIIKKYIRIFFISFKYGLIQSTTYRLSFFIELFVEVGYQFASILTISVIYQNLSTVMGWTKDEMFVLYGFSIMVSQFYVGLLGVWNLWELPSKIKNGDIDFALLKPINSQYNLTIGRPYFTSILNILFGVVVLIIGLTNLKITIDVASFVCALVVFVCGLFITYSITTIIASLSFVFINASIIGRIGGEIIFLKSYPQQIYKGFWKFIFYIVLPIIFIASVPASFITRGIDWRYLAFAVFISVLLFFCSIKLWNRMIAHYSSASS